MTTICQLSLYRCHEAKARGMATPNSPHHSAHGPGNHQEKKEPQTAGNTTAGQSARPVYQMPSRTCHTKQGPLRGVLQKEQRIPNRQKAEARQARNAREQTCCRRAKKLFLVYTGPVNLSYVQTGGMKWQSPGNQNRISGQRGSAGFCPGTIGANGERGSKPTITATLGSGRRPALIAPDGKWSTAGCCGSPGRDAGIRWLHCLG